MMTDAWADELTCSVKQVSLTAQNNYSVMYDLGIAICSLEQTDLLSG